MRHFVKYILVYPEGYADPYRLAEDPDYIPGKYGRLEDERIVIAPSVPTIGSTVNYPTIEDKPATWTVVEKHRYIAQNSEDTFHEVICTQDGDIPQRRDWLDTNLQVLTFYLEGDVLAAEPDGFVPFECSNELWVKDQNPLLFVPEGARPVQGFDIVAIAQSVNSMVAA